MRVLNVDNNDAGRYVMTRLLQGAGFDVQEARTGQEALSSLHSDGEQPDLVVLDVGLPDIDGYEVCRRLKADPATASLPVLQLSAHFTADCDRSIGLEGGADGFLTQPADPRAVIATINTVLRARCAERDLRSLNERMEKRIEERTAELERANCALEREITQRRAAEMALSRSRANLDLSLGVAGGILSHQDTDLRYTWTHNTRRLRAEDCLGKTDEDLFGPEDSAVFTSLKRRVLSTGSNHRQEISLRLNGETFWYDLALEPLRSTLGEIIGVTSASYDITERKRAETETRRISSSARCVLWDAIVEDFGGKFLSWNLLITGERDPTRRYFPFRVAPGMTLEEAFWECRLPDDRSRTDLYAAQQIRESRSYLQEYRCYSQNGEVLWFQEDARVEPLEEVSSSIGSGNAAPLRRWRVIGVAVEITALKATEAALRASLDALHLSDSAIRASSSGILLTDATAPDMPIVTVNPAFERITGFSADEVIGKNCRFLQGIDVPLMEREQIRRAIADGKPVTALLRNYRKDGSLFWNELDIAPVRDDEGRITHFIGIVQDVTERRNLEIERESMLDALRESEQRFQEIARATNDALWEWDLGTDQVWWSIGLETSFGYTREEVGSEIDWWSNRIHPEDRERVLAGLDALIKRRETPRAASKTGKCVLREQWGDEYRFTRADGSYAHVVDRGTVIRGSDGIAFRMVGGMSDITDRKRLQERLIQSGKLAALGELVAGVAHEINNPLAAIGGYAQLLALHDDPTVRDDAGLIQEMVLRMSRIVGSLRSFSRSSSDERHRPQSLNTVVGSALQVVEHKLRSTSIAVVTELEDDLPPVNMNSGQLEQVVVNLLSNAEHALRARLAGDEAAAAPPPRIEIRTESLPGKRCRLSVRDNGCGISREVQERIYDPFFTTKDDGEGTGLGLYISYGIVTAHGGMIAVESQPGEGATFCLTFPAVSGAKREPTPPAGGAAATAENSLHA